MKNIKSNKLLLKLIQDHAEHIENELVNIAWSNVEPIDNNDLNNLNNKLAEAEKLINKINNY